VTFSAKGRLKDTSMTKEPILLSRALERVPARTGTPLLAGESDVPRWGEGVPDARVASQGSLCWTKGVLQFEESPVARRSTVWASHPVTWEYSPRPCCSSSVAVVVVIGVTSFPLTTRVSSAPLLIISLV
jgi:hypothetical protein